MAPGTTPPVDGIGTFHVERRNRTSEELGTGGFCWIQQVFRNACHFTRFDVTIR